MPPKNSGASKKTEKKQQEKVIEDRTFGLKNKNKSKTVQKFIKGVATQVKVGNVSLQKEVNAEFEAKKAKKREEEEKALLASLYKTVATVKKAEEDEETDPKMILCAYFKQGLCQKGKKCKYSHDLEIEKKSEEIDIYTDQRVQIFDQNVEEEDMSKWDEKKLGEVIKAQEGKYKNQKPTEIICKFFIDAVENRKYGWKWLCPNGMACIYRHCLPPGYVLKRDREVVKKDDDTILEEVLEEERSKITSSNGTPITKERFYAWKEEKKKKREEELEKKRKEEAKKTGTKGTHILSGRALFKYDPTLFQIDDDDAVEVNEYENRSEDEEEEKQEKHLDDVEENEGEDNEEEEEQEQEEETKSEDEEDGTKEENGTKEEKIEKIEETKEQGNGKKEEVKENWEELGAEKEEAHKKKKKKKAKKEVDNEVIKDEKNDVNIDKNVFLQEEDI